MNKLFKYISGAVAGLALAAVVSLTGNALSNNVAYADADPCIKITDGINYNQQNANATVKLTGQCGTRKLVMKTYYAPSSTGAPHEAQVLAYTGDAKTLNPGSAAFKLHVQSLASGCFYQVDVVDITDGNAGPKNDIVAAKTGGNHDCTPTPPAYRCISMAAAKTGPLSVGITDYQIAAHNAVYLRTTVQWGDGASDTRVIPQGMGHTYATAGEYTITATSYFQIVGQFGQVKEVAAVPCTTKITFTPEQPNQIMVCELATKNIITINEADFNPSLHSKNLSDCSTVIKQIYVCEIATKNILTINEDEYGTTKYPTDQYTTDLSKCVTKYINVCDLTTKTVVNIEESQYDATKHTTDLSKCKTVTPPATLVNTGPGSIAALVAATAVVAAAAHAIWRRRSA